jgi:hypothetical protein
LTPSDIKAIFDDAEAKHDAAAQARDALAAIMLAAINKLVPPGTVLDLRFGRSKPPGHLARVSTMSGNDRGTKVFRVVKVLSVDAKPGSPELSTWTCEAVPISEKTGKDMLASTGHYSGKQTVRLSGSMSVEWGSDEAPQAAVERVVELVTKELCA